MGLLNDRVILVAGVGRGLGGMSPEIFLMRADLLLWEI